MSRRIAFSHQLVSVETFPDPTGTGLADFVRLRMGDWVNAVAVTADDRIVLVRQLRWGIEEPTLEIPGGSIDPGEEPLAAARRELLEETGYGGGEWRSLGSVHPNPALQDNRTWLFAARGVERIAEPALDPAELVTVELHPAAAICALVREGAISHALALVSLQRFLLGW